MIALSGNIEEAASVCIRHLRVMSPAHFSSISPSISYRKSERDREITPKLRFKTKSSLQMMPVR